MKKIGEWWIPDYETVDKVIKRVRNESWTCIEPIEKCYKYIKKFDRAIDIGTWVGDSTKLMANKFGFVHAFEAKPDVYECCKKNLNEKNITNIDLQNYALSDSDGKKILLNGMSTVSGWINTKEQPAAHAYEAEVECRTLDSFGLTDIDFIKIDVDSHEGYLLQGCKEFFKNNNPIILMEHKLKTINRQRSDMPNPIQFLESIGYKQVEQASRIDIIFTR